MSRLAEQPPAVSAAWAESFLADLPPASADRVLVGARLVKVKAGEVVYRGAFHEQTVAVGLVVEGLLRILMRSSDGREVTIRYAEPGAFVGVPAVLVAGSGAPGDLFADRWQGVGGGAFDGEVLRDSTILRLSPSRFRDAMSRDSELASRVATYLAVHLHQTLGILRNDLFLPVRSRVASHLLDLAEREEGFLVVRMNHQSIAAAIGSVREVVSRALKSMEREGLVARVGGTTGYLRLLDPAALHQVAVTGDQALAP